MSSAPSVEAAESGIVAELDAFHVPEHLPASVEEAVSVPFVFGSMAFWLGKKRTGSADEHSHKWSGAWCGYGGVAVARGDGSGAFA